MIIVLYGIFDPDHFLFPKCPFHSLTGWLCPGCGSQRALHQILHAQFRASFKLNPLFLPGMAYAGLGIISSCFFSGSWPNIRQKFYGLKACYISLIVIVVFWVVRNIVL
jgi:hypothetical protein